MWRHDALREVRETRVGAAGGFPGTTWTTTGRASLSESGALGLLKRRATSMRRPPFVRWPPLRRHVLDPRRRKSSIIPRPFEAGLSCSHWSICSMTTSRPPWRSTVSCPRNPRALPGRPGFPGPWHARTPRNASCTDFPLRNRRSRRLWGNRNGGSLSGRHSVGANRPDVTVGSRCGLDLPRACAPCQGSAHIGVEIQHKAVASLAVSPERSCGTR